MANLNYSMVIGHIHDALVQARVTSESGRLVEGSQAWLAIDAELCGGPLCGLKVEWIRHGSRSRAMASLSCASRLDRALIDSLFERASEGQNIHGLDPRG